VLWRHRPIFVVFRTAETLKALQDPRLLKELADPQSEELQQPPYANNWHRSLTPEIAVLVGVCTHLGCIPQFDPLPNAVDPAPN
jgi:ubiquinol-cytochrome c reductase iron-sulfur subunit